MRKIFLLSVLLLPFIIKGNNRWFAFSIENDTKQIIKFITDSQKQEIKPGEIRNVINSRFSRNPMVTENYKNKIVLQSNKWFKVAETKSSDPERTFAIAQRVNLKPGNSAKLTASQILNKEELPKGFEYQEYPTGLLNPGPRNFSPNMTTPFLGANKKINKQDFYIKNDTSHNVYFIYKNKRTNIKPNKKIKLDSVPVKEEFKVEVMIRGFKGNQQLGVGFRKDKVHVFTLKRNNDFKGGMTLEISRLLPLKGFDIKKQETQNRQL